MELRSNVIINNLINIVIIVLLSVGMAVGLIPFFLFIIMLIPWFAWVIYSNYQFIFRSRDIIDEMRRSDKMHLFEPQIMVFSDAGKSVILKKEMFEQYEDMGKISQAYELIATQVSNNTESALNFIKNYDYISNASRQYLYNLTNETRELIRKLNDLSDMLLQIEDDSHDVDICYVDEMLDSLRRVSTNEQQQG